MGFQRPSCPGIGRTFNHFTHPSVTSPTVLQAVSAMQSHRRWLGSTRPALGGGQPAAEPKKSIRLQVCMMQTQPMAGELMQKYSPTKSSRLPLVHGTKLLACCHPGRLSCSQASAARNPVGGDGVGRGARPALSAASSGAQPLLFFLTLTSPCAALCVTRDYKSHSNREDYFYLLDSTTGKLIVIRGCKEWFTFPALGKIMTQVLHP